MTVRITNTSTNDITEWHTTIVNPQYTLNNLGIDGDTVLHNRGVVVTPDIYNSLTFSCNQFGYGSCPPTNVTFNIEVIQGQEYGNIGKYNDFFGSMEYAPAYTGLSYDEFKYGTYVFTANGLQPDSTAVVRIKQSSSDTDIGSFEYTLYVKRNFLPPVSENGSIVIETNKITAMPGDTIDVLLKWEDGSNGIVDFSDWQEFSVWLADGFSYGTLLNPATGDTSDAFDVIGKDLKLIVHQNVTDANKKIIIAAETEVAILGGNRMLQNNLQPKAETKSVDKKIISNYRKVEQGGFVKEKDKTKSEETVDDEINNTDIIVGSQYLSGIKEITINPFIVEIDPPTVSAGDTARIIPKYMDSTGNYVEFDSLQTFELGILDGCPLGYLIAEADSNQYFYGVKQPFYFIADTSADTGSVNIRVGVIDMNPQNRSLTNNKPNIENDNPVSCANINFVENHSVNAVVVVGGSVCSKLPLCSENNAGKKPNFEIMDFPNGTDGNYVCNNVSGITYMLWSGNGKKLFLPIETENCYDKNANVIQFGIKGDLITLRAIVTACEDEIISRGYTILYDTTELRTKVPQRLDVLGQLLFDLDKLLDYIPEKPSLPKPFYPIELAWEHEFQHKRNYVDDIFNVVNKERDYLDYSRLDVSCGKYGNMNDVVDEMKYNFENKFLDFETKCISKQFEVWGRKDGTPEQYNLWWDNETENTHEKIAKKVIDKYKAQILVLIADLNK